jgi:hypothetical protein
LLKLRSLSMLTTLPALLVGGLAFVQAGIAQTSPDGAAKLLSFAGRISVLRDSTPWDRRRWLGPVSGFRRQQV